MNTMSRLSRVVKWCDIDRAFFSFFLVFVCLFVLVARYTTVDGDVVVMIMPPFFPAFKYAEGRRCTSS